MTCPRVGETIRLISHTEFGLMPRYTILINASRGSLIIHIGEYAYGHL